MASDATAHGDGQSGNPAPCAVIRADTLRPVPWANGGGVTRQILSSPAETDLTTTGLTTTGLATNGTAWRWRLSLATIDKAGSFSALPDVDRHFAVVAGRVELDATTPPFPCILDAESMPIAFPGAVAPHGEPLAGPALALNFMIRKGIGVGRLERLAAGAIAVPATGMVLFALGPVAVRINAWTGELSPHDSLVLAPTARAVAIDSPCLAAILPCD